MLFYIVRTTAPWHKAANIPCQDDYSIMPSGDNSYMIAAVADGLGSELYTDIASHIAAETSVAFCSERISSVSSDEEIQETMKGAFEAAYKAIVARAKEDGNDLDEYDTTLCLSVFNEESGTLFYGQSGDSGIVVLREDGIYQKITEEQQNEDGDVQPLCFGQDYWVFNKVDNIAAVAIMTDGLLKLTCPYSLRGKPCEVNVYFIEQFLQRNALTLEDIPSIEREATEYIDNIPDFNVDDDKTIVCMFRNNVVVQSRETEYYSPLDWKALRQSKKQLDIEESSQCANNEVIFQSDKNSKEKSASSTSTNSVTTGDSTSSEEPEEKPPPQKKIYFLSPACIQTKEKTITRKVYDLILLCLIGLFSVFVWLFRNRLATNLPVSYLSIIILCFLANATVLLPSASILVVLQFASLLQSPLSAALAGGLGSSLGEFVGYYFGSYSSHALQWTLFKKLEERFPKHPVLWVAVFSFLPLPIFDIIGVWAGAVGMNKRNFFLACFCGKTAKMLLFVISWNMISKFIRI